MSVKRFDLELCQFPLVKLLFKSEGLLLAFELNASFIKLQLVKGVASWTLVACSIR